MNISEQIRTLCSRLNISQAELARLTGQSPQSLSAKLRRRSFTVDELDKLADAAGVRFKRVFVISSGEEI